MKIKRNRSSFCVMPILDIARNDLFWDNPLYYLNCYVAIEEFPEDKDKFYLLFNFDKNTEAYLAVREILSKNDYYAREICHSSKTQDYILFVFNIPSKFKRDVTRFREGKYSKLSREYKNLIFKVHKVTDKKELYHIIMKTDKRRLRLSNELNYDIDEETELWEKPKHEDLILILSDLK